MRFTYVLEELDTGDLNNAKSALDNMATYLCGTEEKIQSVFDVDDVINRYKRKSTLHNT